jgi:hypothetical protein
MSPLGDLQADRGVGCGSLVGEHIALKLKDIRSPS